MFTCCIEVKRVPCLHGFSCRTAETWCQTQVQPHPSCALRGNGGSGLAQRTHCVQLHRDSLQTHLEAMSGATNVKRYQDMFDDFCFLWEKGIEEHVRILAWFGRSTLDDLQVPLRSLRWQPSFLEQTLGWRMLEVEDELWLDVG